MEYADLNRGLDDLVLRAKGPDDINDAFCFVVGFTAAELNRRIAELFDKPKMTAAERKLFGRYGLELYRLESGWAAFHTYETAPNTPPKTKAREAGQASARKLRKR